MIYLNGINISDTAITFHYVTPAQMYVMEYLIYTLNPYGLSHRLGKYYGTYIRW